jgi:hypothetical protein
MKTLVMTIVLGASLLTSACAYNLAVKTASDRIYLNTNLKAASLSAVQAITESNLTVQSSTNPVSGMVVITARGTENHLLHIGAPTLTLTLAEVDPTQIRVAATALMPGQTDDFGLTQHMVASVFKGMDAKLEVAGQTPRQN